MQADLEAMTSSQRSLSSELGTELMARLSEEDQNEVDQINAEFQQLQERLRSALTERSAVGFTACIVYCRFNSGHL
ncbi:structural maintenance of chromosomes 3 [Paramuricea clavata]|uniref:Structural maintenance of chromosomes 3, partial n=1 Tax=Paramuricea clavata TaxID=317549 RepID=A0A6S7JUQ6_PARCT|nr:structural maintenance of chromosomes 3 [Paramuricea clavata]